MSKDYQNKTRAAGYFNNLLLTNHDKLMRKYSLTGSDDIEGDTGAVTANPVRNGHNYEWTVMGHQKRIAYVDLRKLPRRPNAQLNYAPGADDAVFVNGQFASRNNYIPIYFLPWIKANSGGVPQLEIPNFTTSPTVQDNEGNNIPNPAIFFTASITGCSIFFQGTAQNPTVFHAGGATGHSNNPVNAANHWRAIVDANRDVAKGAITGEVNKTEYISDPNVRAGASTARADAYKTWLDNKYQNKLNVTMVQPWGCVFGFRTGNDWTFYLQENATIFYFEFTKKHFYSAAAQAPTALMKGVARPMIVREVFPNAAVAAVIPNQQPKLSFA
jgi:hypothetical protein